MKIILLILALLAITNCEAQNPFKRLPRPEHMLVGETPITSAFRFTGPIAGYMYPQDKFVTGFGYGWEKLHFDTNKQKYYADLSVILASYVADNSLPYAFGISLGAFNQLIMIGPAYNLPTPGKKGSFGVVVNLSMTLNN